MHKSQAFRGEFLFCRATAKRALPVLLGLLLSGLSASVAFGQELNWAKGTGGTEKDNGTRIAVDQAGNSCVIGFFAGTATFEAGEPNQTILTSGGESEIFVARYDSAGALLWVKPAGTDARGFGIAVDSVGNCYITGGFWGTATFAPGEANQTTLTSEGYSDIFVAKYNSVGELMWAKRAGGIGADESYDIAVDGVGNSYVTGLFGYADIGDADRPATFGPGEANQTILTGGIFVAKYESAGGLVWAKRAGTGNHSFGIAVDVAGNSYVTGEFEGTATFGPGEANQTILTSEDNVAFVAKYDSAGALMWVKQAGTYALGLDIAVDGVGNSYATGFFGGSGSFRGTAPFGAGGANQTILNSAGNGDVFVAKYDSAGALLWARRAGGTGGDGANGIAVDVAGNSYVTGDFEGAATFGPREANETILNSAGNRDVFVAKYDSAGALLWARRAGGTERDGANGIAVDVAGNSYVTGHFEGTATFGPGEANQAILISAGNDEVFVAKYGPADQAGPITSRRSHYRQTRQHFGRP